jgi:hypothetical protein
MKFDVEVTYENLSNERDVGEHRLSDKGFSLIKVVNEFLPVLSILSDRFG